MRWIMWRLWNYFWFKSARSQRTQFVLVRETHRNLIDTINYQKIASRNAAGSHSTHTFIHTQCSKLSDWKLQTRFVGIIYLCGLSNLGCNEHRLTLVWFLLRYFAIITAVVRSAWNSHKLFARFHLFFLLSR